MDNDNQPFYTQKYYLWDDMKVFGPAARHTRRIILKWLEDLTFSNVIDISCGGGQLLAKIGKKFGAVGLTGTELTEKAVEVNRQKDQSTNFELFEIEHDEPLTKRDLVLCIDVLEHINGDQDALRKLKAMTNKYLLIAVPLGKVTIAERESLGHLHGYTTAEINAKLSIAELKVIKSLQWGFPFYSIVRTLTNRFSQSPAEGRVTTFKKLIFNFLYLLYFVNLPIFGGRYFVLCKPLIQNEISN